MKAIISRTRVNRVDTRILDPDSLLHDKGYLVADVPVDKLGPVTEIETLFEFCVDTITNLFDLSVNVQRATHRDRYA